MEIKESIEQVRKELQAYDLSNAEMLEKYRIQFLGSKGSIKGLFTSLREVPAESKREIGQLLNELRNEAQGRFDAKKDELESSDVRGEKIDTSRTGEPISIGARHPLSLVRSEIIEIFKRIGFSVSEGPEIEDDWHNFSALNFPPEHPARDMQDTFFVEKGENEMALRTHTSSVQVRVMENEKPPIRTISPGRVYRNEAISARAH